MERFIFFAVGAIILVIGLYLFIFNIPIAGNLPGTYGGWSNSNVGGTPVVCIGVFIICTAYIMKPDKKKE